jgi:hypothetical protein
MVRARVVGPTERAEAIKSNSLAQATDLRYKTTIDALEWLLDTGKW